MRWIEEVVKSGIQEVYAPVAQQFSDLLSFMRDVFILWAFIGTVALLLLATQILWRVIDAYKERSFRHERKK